MNRLITAATALALSLACVGAGAQSEPVRLAKPTGHLVVVKAGLMPPEFALLAGELASQSDLTTYLDLKVPVDGRENQFFAAIGGAFGPFASLKVLVLTDGPLPRLFVLSGSETSGPPAHTELPVRLVQRVQREAQGLGLLRGRFMPLT